MHKETLGLYIIFLIITTHLVSCASSGELTGGDKDTRPPMLIVEESTSSLITNYGGEKIELKFDEFIVLSNPSDVIVSPPLSYTPEIEIRGKKLTFSFSNKETLKEDVTYVIDFSEGLKDFTEGNKPDSLKYIFSTGDKIDEIKMKGSIKNEDPKYKLGGNLVMLYANTSDSITLKEKPLYYVKTDDKGNFNFSNLKAGSYKIIGLEDKNANYFNDLTTESIGFMDSLIVLTVTGRISTVELEMFYPETPLKLVSINEERYGQIAFEFNEDAEDVLIDIVGDGIEFYRVNDKREVMLWYSDTLDRVSFHVLDDTLDLKLPILDTMYTNKEFRVEGYSQKMSPEDSLVITFSAPIISYIDSLIQLKTIDNEDVDYTISTVGKEMIIKWISEGGNYKITIDSGGVENIYNQKIDSTGLNFKKLTYDELLDVEMELKNLDSLSQYLISLVIENNIVAQTHLEGKRKDTISFLGLIPDSYELMIVEDSNLDGKWTVGDYWERRRPEKQKTISVTLMTKKDESQSIDWKTGKKIEEEVKGEGLKETHIKTK